MSMLADRGLNVNIYIYSSHHFEIFYYCRWKTGRKNEDMNERYIWLVGHHCTYSIVSTRLCASIQSMHASYTVFTLENEMERNRK